LIIKLEVISSLDGGDHSYLKPNVDTTTDGTP
jgi:hypothetical protein